MGVTDDLTSDTRLDEDGVSYIKQPSPDLDYFSLVDCERSATFDRARGRARPLLSNDACRGRMKTRFAAVTTIPARTKASVFMPKR